MSLLNPLPPRQIREQQAAPRGIVQGGADAAPVSAVGDGPDDAGTFRTYSKIDMKQLVSAGKMSISPSNREIALASRAGLYIIDLENPSNVPAFLPQGGMWEIADVQWNPHPSWSQYILSTSSEKLLVWNLSPSSKMHIERILQSHFRAITDINWHPSIPSHLATCAIDSWVYLWDLRSETVTTKIKPTMGLSAFNESATQVKWNYHNEHVLATSHNKHVLVWDNRKGSVPLSTIVAHDSNIYGISWSRLSEAEIITCSLDKTIKTWDAYADPSTIQPLSIIQTEYPVWRARNLPFGRGILAQPQRGRLALDMYNTDHPEEPVHVFGGFSEAVTESVWRIRGGGNTNHDDREFQLITWDRGSVLRFWPIDAQILQKVNFRSTIPAPVSRRQGIATDISYRDLLEAQTSTSRAITAPTHQSGVLKSVRVKPRMVHRDSMSTLHVGSSSPVNHFTKPQQSQSSELSGQNKIGNMTMGKGHGKAARPQIDPITWLSGLGEGKRRSKSTGSGTRDSDDSRSRSLPESSSRNSRGNKGVRSKSRAPDEWTQSDPPSSLREEVTQAAQKFSASKVKIVDINLNSGTRKCNLEVHGHTSLFIRILFTFPDDYPAKSHPPTVDIDPNRKIIPRKRAWFLRELRKICSQNILCIEPCIRFLLGLPSGGQDVAGAISNQKPFSLEEDDSEEEDVEIEKVPDMESGGASLIQQNQPPRERTAQAVFSTNGMLVRIIANDSTRPKPGTLPSHNDPMAAGKSNHHLGDLPLALRGLAKMAKQLPALTGPANADAHDFADAFSTQPGVKHTSTGILGPMWNRGMPFKARGKGKAIVCIQSFPAPDPDSFDPLLASKFVYTIKDPVDFCAKNALTAALHGRDDYRRILETLSIILRTQCSNQNSDPLGQDPVEKGIKLLYERLLARGNLQMLAMLSIARLLAEDFNVEGSNPQSYDVNVATTPSDGKPTGIGSSVDYFSLRPRCDPPQPVSPATPRADSPKEDAAPVTSTPPASSPFGTITSKAGGAFTNVLYPLFFTGTSEGSEPSHRSRGSDPPTPATSDVPGSIPVPQRGGMVKSNARSPRKRRGKSDATAPPSLGSAPASGSGGTSSLGRLGLPSRRKPPSVFVPTPGTVHKATVTFAIVGAPPRHVTSSIPQDRWKREGKMPASSATLRLVENTSRNRRMLADGIRAQYVAHIRFYAELLYRSGLVEARSEVLLITKRNPLEVVVSTMKAMDLEIHNVCGQCVEAEVHSKCPKCRTGRTFPDCTVCRLPVRGLSRTCLQCNHVTHIRCWALRQSQFCASGCGFVGESPATGRRPVT
ncbi:hypothetical protein FRC18_010317 [Serendipita sp. 400]|nr:hypothetical protein FRC18_010317 [Serendipita sp. 400]